MNKGRFIKTVAATLCLTSMMSIAAFAYSQVSSDMDGYGKASLTQDRNGGLGKGHAYTDPKNNYQTLTILKAYYDDGDVGEKQDGPKYDMTFVSYDYAYIESFTSIHKIINDGVLCSYVELPQ